MKYFGGIEGGATHSRLTICDENGLIISQTTGLGTNHWMVGIPECSRRIADMVDRAKAEGGIDPTCKLYSIGLSLSGCEQEATNKDLERELRQTFPDLADNYYVCSDTIGSIFTASPIGGLVLIAGTGSNALLKNPNGSFFGCGGWGNFLGDEGSAWYMAYRAIKICYDDMDNFRPSIYSTDKVWELIQQHFNITTRLEILDHCYAKFDKPYFAGLCAKLSQAAKEGDKLCQSIFSETGVHLAKHICALIPKVEDGLVANGELNIVCVGSVWLSWDLFKESFLKELNKYNMKFGLKFCRINKGCSIGAVYMAADHVGFPLPRSYDDNFDVLFYFNQHNDYNLNKNHSSLNGSNAQDVFIDAENVIS